MISDDDASRQVSDPHRRVGSVNALAAVAAGAVNIDAQVVRVDFDVSLLSFWQHRYGDGGGVDAALAFGDRHALDTVDAAFKFQFGVWRVAFDHENNFFITARIVGGFADKLSFIAVSLAPA